jgi:hypothetical protein
MQTYTEYSPTCACLTVYHAHRLHAAKNWIESCKEFQVTPVGPLLEESPTFQSHRDLVASFGYSIRAFLLYAQVAGNGSTRSPGFFIELDGSTFGLGLYLQENTVNAHVISPIGTNWRDAVSRFSRMLLATNLVDRVYVRHISEKAGNDLESVGFAQLNAATGWCARAAYEDESFNHRHVELGLIVCREADGGIKVRNLESNDSGNFKTKFRLAFQRGENFLARNGLVYKLRPYTAVDAQEVQELVQAHFAVLEQSRRAIGSCALDYQLLLDTLLHDPARYISFVGVLRNDDQEVIASIFLGERTGEHSGGLYCSITNRSKDELLRVLPNVDLSGFTALPQYSLARLFGELQTQGWKSVDLGGSETEDLDRFKRQMGATEVKTTWRVMM